MTRTPSEAEIIRGAVYRILRNTWTMLPGKVLEYDATTQKCSVQPLLRITFTDLEESVTEIDRTEALPVISDVPVVWPRTKYAYIYLPMKPGAKVMLLFATRSLDKWSVGDGEQPQDPQDVRHHDLSDAVAVPGLFPFGDPIPSGDIDDDDIRIINNHPTGGRTEIYLGGDTGDVVIIPASAVQLGQKDLPVEKGVARLNDEVTADKTETDPTFFTWLVGLVEVLKTWVVVPNDGGAALQTAINAYITSNPVPEQLVSKITNASTIVRATD